ncbi:MAG TPA: hypothetical protein VGE02_01180 [Gemmatimonadales bacterium]
MSEYQWYEFVALDRPLSAKQMAELRAISTRAEITSTRFWNEYQWGDLKTDPTRLLARYFDAHLYFANWGTRRFMLRLPVERVDERALRAYFPRGGPATITRASAHIVLDFVSDTENPEDAWWQPASLASLTPLRASLLEGDLSAAYIAWLLAVQWEEVDDDAPEPDVPAGVAAPSAPLAALAEFLRIDPDLLQAAAEGCRSERVEPAALRRWIAGLSETEKDRWLVRALERPVGAELLASYRTQHASAPDGAHRTVGELRARAELARRDRAREAAKRRARERAAAATARARQLVALEERQDAEWVELEGLVGAPKVKPSVYEDIVRRLAALRELAVMRGTEAAFRARLGVLLDRYGSKATFLRRVQEAGLMQAGARE